MMLVKAHDGEGNWHLFEAHWDLVFSGPNVLVEVPVTEGRDGPEANLGNEAVRGFLPLAEYTHGPPLGPFKEGATFTLVRWVRWLDADNESHRLITQHEVYICNADGQTIEALR